MFDYGVIPTTDDKFFETLKDIKTIAVVGLSPKTD